MGRLTPRITFKIDAMRSISYVHFGQAPRSVCRPALLSNAASKSERENPSPEWVMLPRFVPDYISKSVTKMGRLTPRITFKIDAMRRSPTFILVKRRDQSAAPRCCLKYHTAFTRWVPRRLSLGSAAFGIFRDGPLVAGRDYY